MSHDSRLASLARCCFAFFFLWISLATNCFSVFAQQFAYFSSSSHLVVSSTNSLGDSMRFGGNSLILKSCQFLLKSCQLCFEILPTLFFLNLVNFFLKPLRVWDSIGALCKGWADAGRSQNGEFQWNLVACMKKTGKILKLKLSSGGTALLGNSPWRWKQSRDWKQWNCDEVKCSFRYNNKFVFISNSSNFPNTKFEKI